MDHRGSGELALGVEWLWKPCRRSVVRWSHELHFLAVVEARFITASAHPAILHPMDRESPRTRSSAQVIALLRWLGFVNRRLFLLRTFILLLVRMLPPSPPALAQAPSERRCAKRSARPVVLRVEFPRPATYNSGQSQALPPRSTRRAARPP
jgi:hypothetical protein